MKKHWKLIVFVAIEFSVVITIVLLTMFAGRKTYTVTFDLNGGTYISGSLTQTVRHGKSATPPEVTKDGAYLLKWSESYTQITKDKVISAVWEYETSYGIQFEFVGNSNYCLISGCYESISGDVYIGSYHNGMRVMGIKDGAFKNRTRITGIYLLDGLVSIGKEAFMGCTNLKTIEIPSTVEVIGSNILKDCQSLEKMTVPFIGDSLGEDTKNYFGYFFGANSYLYNQKYVPETLTNVTINGNTEIPEKSFYDCSSIIDITFEESVTKINANAFRNCSGLKNIVIGEGITEIGKAAFVNCTELQTVVLGSLVKKIGEAAFANCTNLVVFNLNASVKEIAKDAFQNCPNLILFEIEEGNSYFTVENKKLIAITEEGKEEYIIEEVVYEDDFENEENTLPGFNPGTGLIKPGFGIEDWEDIFKEPTDEELEDFIKESEKSTN